METIGNIIRICLKFAQKYIFHNFSKEYFGAMMSSIESDHMVNNTFVVLQLKVLNPDTQQKL